MKDTSFLSIRDAIVRRKSNPAYSWPSRGAESNRLEPECWPEIRPSFKIRPGAKVFTIGSCFARNIEQHLAAMGFDVAAISAVRSNPEMFGKNGSEVLNKYTPTSIHQELVWARSIRDRDDTVRMEDVTPLLLDVGNDRYLDLQTGRGVSLTVEEHLARRRAIYALNREAFDCDLAVMTLGLIEAWWDTTTGKTVEFDAKLLRHPQAERYAFRRLRYDEAYDATEKAVRLILDNPRANILITTSPVPLGSTFTDDDVIIANSYSKSMLRTVTGAVAESFERVDYFPSYESVMLTRKPEVWSDDLIHVEQNFIGYVMARVVRCYVSDDNTDSSTEVSTREYEDSLRFSEHVSAKNWEAARPVYDRLVLSNSAEPVVLLKMAEFAMAAGETENARKHLVAAGEESAALGRVGPRHFIACARMHEQLGDASAADELRAKALEQLRSNAVKMRGAIKSMRRRNWTEEAEWLMAQAERLHHDSTFMLDFLLKIARDDGRKADARRLRYARGVLDEPAEVTIERASKLLVDKRGAEAIDALKRFAEPEGQAPVFRCLAQGLLQENRNEEAEVLIRRRLEREAEDAVALGLLARVLARRGARREALEMGRRAIALGYKGRLVAALVERLSGADAAGRVDRAGRGRPG